MFARVSRVVPCPRAVAAPLCLSARPGMEVFPHLGIPVEGEGIRPLALQTLPDQGSDQQAGMSKG